MPAVTTMTIEISQDLKDKLDALAAGGERSSTRLASDAIGAFVEDELALRNAIENSLNDGRVGRTIPHAQAIAGMRDAIAAVRSKRDK